MVTEKSNTIDKMNEIYVQAKQSFDKITSGTNVTSVQFILTQWVQSVSDAINSQL